MNNPYLNEDYYRRNVDEPYNDTPEWTGSLYNNVSGQYPWDTHHKPHSHAITQPRLNRKPAKRPRWVIIWTVTGSVISLLCIAILCVLLATSSNDTPALVQLPKSAGEVADQLDCTGFQEFSPGSSGMVVTAGTCMKDGVKYAIDTFASQDVRDAWLQTAEKLGVVPTWETATSVTYKSVG